jgi:AbrB family looped-hinge helix DNA binding protein
MGQNQSVKVSSRFQIAIPSAVRKKLDIQAGDRLLVDVQDDVIVLVPKPSDYTEQMTGLYKEIWEKQDSDRYLNDERETWEQ